MCKACSRQAHREWRERNPDKRREQIRRSVERQAGRLAPYARVERGLVDRQACTGCGIEKPLSEFPTDRRAKYQVSRRCSECAKAHHATWRGARRNHVRQKAREVSRRQRELRPDRIRETLRRSRLKRYGLTPEGVDALFLSQDGRCAICKTSFGDERKPHIDHDHATGKLRKLLCSPCNTGLGCFSDKPELLAAAATYLAEHAAPGQ